MASVYAMIVIRHSSMISTSLMSLSNISAFNCPFAHSVP